MMVVCECLWFLEKIKLYQILLFSPKSFLVFSVYDNGIGFPFGLLQGLNFGQKPPCANKSFCLYMCSHILHNI